MILEDRVISRLDYAAVFRRIRQLCVMLLQLAAQQKPAFHFELFVAQFLAARLDGKIG